MSPSVKRMGTISAMVMQIVTKFTTADEFVVSFARFCSESSCFIPSAIAKQTGIETGFSIRLADGTQMLRGSCVVLESFETGDNPFKRPGVQLRIRKLTPESKALFYRLRVGSDRVELPDEQLDDHTKATVQMEPLIRDEGGIPELLDIEDSTTPVPLPAEQLARLVSRAPRGDITVPTPGVAIELAEPEADITVPSRAPVMTLLGVAPLSATPRTSAPRIAMPALAPVPEREITTDELPPVRRPSVWAMVVAPISALLRRIRWAYRRRRGVRASLRRLPTRT
jgi:hypothetical protein